MTERKLPVVYAVVSGDGFPMDFARSRDRAEEFSKTRTKFDPLIVEYIPRPVVDAIVAELEQMFRAAHELPADPYFEGKADAYDAALVIIDKRLKSYAERKARGE